MQARLMARTKAAQKARLGVKRQTSRSSSKAKHRAHQGPTRKAAK